MTMTDRPTPAVLLRRILDSVEEIAALDPTLGAARTGQEGKGLTLVVTPQGRVGLHEDSEYLRGDVYLYHGLHQTLQMPPHAAPEDIAEWIEQHATQFVAVCEGLDRRWDGRNMIGDLTAGAEDALTELQEAAEDLAPDLPRVLFDPQTMFESVRDMLENQDTEEEAVALAVKWGEEGETEHGLSATVVMDYDLIREYASQVWRAANEDEE